MNPRVLAFFQSIGIHPHWSLWIVLPLLPIAVAAIAILYLQQRKLASARTVLMLTVLRLALVLLVALLFLRPSGRWEQKTTTNGTLWFLVDQSPSMLSKDGQATDSERIAWAEALGYLDPKVRPAKPDLVRANFIAVQSQFAALRPESLELAPVESAEAESARARSLAAQLAAWAEALEKVQKMAGDDPAFAGAPGLGVRDDLERAAAAAQKGASAAKSAATLADAAKSVDWDVIQTNLTLAGEALTQLTEQSARDFENAHGQDSAVSEAVAHVSDLTRSDLAYDFLTTPVKRGDRSISDLLGKYHVRIAAFSDTAEASGSVDQNSFAQTLRTALNPGGAGGTGTATNIITGLQTVAAQIGPDEPASIVIVSDGRHNTPGDPAETARLLAARGVHVYGLLVGSHAVSADAAVDQIDAPEWVFKGDTLKAQAILRFDGLKGKIAHVEFRREGALVDSQNVPITGNQMLKSLEFHDKTPATAGVLEYEVRIAELPGEANRENNVSTFRVAVKKDKLYALYIEDRPRWEFRYVAAYLSRDQRLKLQTVLLHPATILGVSPPPPVMASPSNPGIEAQILPITPDQWKAFDVIILGDLPAGTLTPAQQQDIAADVRDKGATLITIAGERSMPESLANEPLAEILPVTLVPQWDDAAIARHKRFGFRPGLAPEGNGSVLGQLAPDPGANAALWANMPLWYWHSPYTQAKPSASVLWSITENDAAAGIEAAPGAAKKNALLATMSVGLGKSLYLASDQTWRLRSINGANAQDRFWGQVLTWAVGSNLPAGGKFVRFGASQSRYSQGQPVEITARVLKEDLTPYAGLSGERGFYAVARSVKSANAPAAQSSAEAAFIESPETAGYYTAKIGGLAPGEYEISLLGSEVERLLDSDPTVTQKTLRVKVDPQLDLEQRNMNTDPELLRRVALAGGGFSLDANFADVLASHLPAIQRTETSVQNVGFFTDPSARGTWIAHLTFAILFALLLTAEWALRKTAGLV